jgi:hypothetical protein
VNISGSLDWEAIVGFREVLEFKKHRTSDERAVRRRSDRFAKIDRCIARIVILVYIVIDEILEES